jgi:hypothetical protein
MFDRHADTRAGRKRARALWVLPLFNVGGLWIQALPALAATLRRVS